ncbi:hypothetical protein G6O69_01135 [Pseudenhygromyxa sp. WMMC2535]|uniref:hypothetical protein n=1 Tax=Pseudenhygromyxa sp. WMMC2535 TaxID=2712867 RepID=UPI0015536DAA|nr:hypothetical protein [Pseudenhygromyxa sp. WMMC2535]NVB36415.1 hypothetical protein [Pseudenhygromyxa sp. WMMC2535]
MASETQASAGVALDGYTDYYTEKLWQWLPGYHREEDASTGSPGTLRGIIEAMGEESAEVRRALDRIWENHFVELADDEALARLGALVATRMVHALNRRGRRVDVAKTIWYRRRKGTPRVLESLSADIAGWLGAHLETRLRLARSVHLLEPAPSRERIRAQAIFTGTPRGGWANLRSPRIPALAWTAFEELAHTPDFRPLRGHEGRYNIPRVNLHVHRMRAFEINYPTVVELEAGGEGAAWKYVLDPSGREVPLFVVADRPEDESWTRQREWQMPKVIERRLLAHAEFEWSQSTLETFLAIPLQTATVELLAKYKDLRFPSLRALERLIGSFPTSAADDITHVDHILAVFDAALVRECGKAQLYGPDPETEGNQALSLAIGADNSATALSRGQVAAGNLSGWGSTWDLSAVLDAAKPMQQAIVDPERGAVISQASDGSSPLLAPVLHYGFSGEVGAGSYDRRGSIIVDDAVALLDNDGDAPGPVSTTLATAAIEQLQDSKTYDVSADLSGVEDYRLQAANFTRPYLRYVESESEPDTVWTITAADKLVSTDERNLSLDGLWIGLHDPSVGAVDPCPPVGGRLRLAGTWDRVEISHCTLDPGGQQMSADGTTHKAIQYVVLEIAGYVEELIIDRSIVGPILGTVAGDACSIGKLTIRDSIVLAVDYGVAAIDVEFGELHVEGSTIGGDVVANRLYASDSLFDGSATITDLQHGCFRFSAGIDGSWPRPYEHYVFDSFDIAWLESPRFGDPGFARLSKLAPSEILTGAENHGEMGVWNHLIDPIKRGDLRAKLDEFMPFDLQTTLVTEN